MSTVHRLKTETPFGTLADTDCPFCLYDEDGLAPTAGMCDQHFDERFPVDAIQGEEVKLRQAA